MNKSRLTPIEQEMMEAIQKEDTKKDEAEKAWKE